MKYLSIVAALFAAFSSSAQLTLPPASVPAPIVLPTPPMPPFSVTKPAVITFGVPQDAPTNIPPQQTFFETVASYLTSQNTNLLTFQKTNELDLWAGADYVTGVQVSASLGIEYNVYKKISIESVTRNAGIGGVVVSQQGGVGLNFVVHDVKLTGYLDGGYDFYNKRPYAALGIRAKKALTENTFAGIGMETPITKHGPQSPILTLFTGFTF